MFLAETIPTYDVERKVSLEIVLIAVSFILLLATYRSKNMFVDDTLVRFNIWDMAGARRFAQEAPKYYNTTQAAIVVYDITNVDTFSWAKRWIQEIQSNASPDTIIALVGNKKDLANSRKVEYEVR